MTYIRKCAETMDADTGAAAAIGMQVRVEEMNEAAEVMIMPPGGAAGGIPSFICSSRGRYYVNR